MARRAHRRFGRGGAVAGVVGILLVTTSVLVSAGQAAANEAAETTGLAGNGLIRVEPIDEPSVAVVARSAPVEGSVAIVVANGTSEETRVRKVVATATASSGARTVRASTRTVVPRVLQPGAQALGSVKFRPDSVRFDDTFTFDVTTAKVRSRDPVPLATGSFVLSPPGTGTVAQTLDLVVTNDSTRKVDGRVDVRVVCLGEAGNPTTSASATVKRAKLAPGATLPASVDFDLLCPVYVVGAEGRPAR